MSAPQFIVVGFDGSEESSAAVQWAAILSTGLGARLRIIHAVGLLEQAGMGTRVVAHEQQARQIAEDAGVDGDDVEWSVVDGDPTSVLLRASTMPVPTLLVVVGSRGTNIHRESPLGSTSLELAERCHVPVMIVPTGRLIGAAGPA